MPKQTTNDILLKIFKELKSIKEYLKPTELDELQLKIKELENRIEILEQCKVIPYQPLRPFPGTGTDPYYPQPPIVWCNNDNNVTSSPKLPINEVVGKIEKGSTRIK